MADPYVYPGTNTLINRFNVRNQDVLEEIESQYFYIRAIKPLPKGSFNYEHLKAIHKHLFSDVYEWAGQERTVNISKNGNLFAHVEFIAPSLNSLFNKLNQDDHLRGLEKTVFCSKLSYYFNEVNAVHPFREGNGRSQRTFFEELANYAGYNLDWMKIDREAYLKAAIAGFNGDNLPMAKVFHAISDISAITLNKSEDILKKKRNIIKIIP